MSDMLYWFKRAMGTLTPEEEQAHRAAGFQEQLRTTPVTPTVPETGPTQVQPGNALRQRQDVLDEATQELERQNRGALRNINPQPRRLTPEEEEAARRRQSFPGMSGIRG